MRSTHTFTQTVSAPILSESHLLFLYSLLSIVPFFLTWARLSDRLLFDRLTRSLILYTAWSSVSLYIHFCSYLHDCPRFFHAQQVFDDHRLCLFYSFFFASYQSLFVKTPGQVSEPTDVLTGTYWRQCWYSLLWSCFSNKLTAMYNSVSMLYSWIL